jgi:hypothetical protein
MSGAIRTSYSLPDDRQANPFQESASGTHADAALRHGGLSDSAGMTGFSPRHVIRGESKSDARPIGAYPIDIEGKIVQEGESLISCANTDLLHVGTRKKGSVRVNLSVPSVVDEVLSALCEKSGGSKASLVMQALHSYLPALRRRLAEHDEIKSQIHPKQVVAAKGEPPQVANGGNLSRSERRRLERQRQKAASRGGSGE